MDLSKTKLYERLRTFLALLGLAFVLDRLAQMLNELLSSSSEDEAVDYVLMFSKECETDEDKAETKRLILANIVRHGLTVESIDDAYWNKEAETEAKKDSDSKVPRVTVYCVSASFESLCSGAEKIRLRKRVRQAGLNAFTVANASKFDGWVSSKEFFTRSERQRIVRYMLLNLRSDDDDQVPLLLRALHNKIVMQIFPLSDGSEAKNLLKDWSRTPGTQPLLDRVANYFGTEITFSFAWLEFYTWFLRVPAFVGILAWLFTDTEYSTLVSVFYALFMSIGATVFLEMWKRQSIRLQYTLGSEKSETLQRTRPNFVGEMRQSNVTGKQELFYPSWKRWLKTALIMPVIFALNGVTVFSMLAMYECDDYINMHYSNSLLVYAPTFSFSILVQVLNHWYSTVAVRCTDWENHRTETSYQNALILRLVQLKFTNSFLSLFYVLFWLHDIERLRSQLAALFITTQITGQLQEVGIPLIMTAYHAYKAGKSTTQIAAERKASSSSRVSADGKRIMPAVEAESLKEEYSGTFDDYLEMVLQFGYVFMFGWAWPLAPAAALLNNLTETRTDMFKLCFTMRKPAGKDASGIGPWYFVLETLSVFAVIVNAGFLLVHLYVERETLWPHVSLLFKLGMVVLCEHIVLAIKVILTVTINDVPADIREKQALEELALEKISLDMARSRESSLASTADEKTRPKESRFALSRLLGTS